MIKLIASCVSDNRCVVSSHKNFSSRTYVATAMSLIQATVPERGQRFLLATLGNTACWEIRR
jgi:hypothetical protein